MVRHRFACISIVVAWLSGCATMETHERLEALDLSLNTYASAVRWGNYEDAARYRLSRTGPYPPVDLTAFRDVRVTNYDIVVQAIDPPQMEAIVSVEIRYYREDTGRVEALRERQKWWYNPAFERWFLDGDLPAFGTR